MYGVIYAFPSAPPSDLLCVRLDWGCYTHDPNDKCPRHAVRSLSQSRARPRALTPGTAARRGNLLETPSIISHLPANLASPVSTLPPDPHTKTPVAVTSLVPTDPSHFPCLSGSRVAWSILPPPRTHINGHAA